MTNTYRLILASVVLIASAGTPAGAQQATEKPPLLSTVPSPPAGATPVPADMSGQPLQVGDLPPGVAVVRVIRRSFAENMRGERVQLQVGPGGRQMEAATDDSGRARFDGLRVGDMVRVSAVIDGEPLGSAPFVIPSEGGVRMLLVAGVGAGVPVPVESIAMTDSRPSAETVRQSGSTRWIVSIDAASVAITLFAVAGGAILWTLRPRQRASSRKA